MKKNRLTLAPWALAACAFLANAEAFGQEQTVVLTTSKTVGSSMTIVVNNNYKGISVDWGDGNAQTYTADGTTNEQTIVGTVQGSTITISGNDNFTMLAVPGCGLTSLDLENARGLRSLYCQNNELTTLDLRGMLSLLDLDCSNNQITSFTFTSPTYPERDIAYIENLNVSGNKLTGTFVARTSTLQNLNISDNEYTSIYTSSNPKLRSFFSENNSFSTIALTGNPYLETIVINSSCNRVTFPSAGLASLKQIYLQDVEATSLDLSSSSELSDVHAVNTGMTSLALPSKKLDNLNVSNNSLDFRSLPGRANKPTNLVFLPQTDVDITSAAGLQQNSDGVYYAPLCPTWTDRTNDDYRLDLSPWRYIGVNANSTGQNDVTFTWYTVDDNGEATALTAGNSQSNMNDYYTSSGLFAFFTGQGRAYATMTSRTYGLSLNTMPIAIGESFTTGIAVAPTTDGGLSISTSARQILLSSSTPVVVHIFSLDGKNVWTGTVDSSEQSVSLPSGVYIVGGKKVVI